MFTIKIYGAESAAESAGKGKNQDVIGRVVVSYQQAANSTGVYGQPGAKNATATAAIKKCIDDVSS